VKDGGQYLVAVDESNDHVMSVWDWQKTDRGQRIMEVKVLMSLITPFNSHCKSVSKKTYESRL